MEVTVAGDEGSPRLDRVLAARLPELSRSRLKALILAGQVSMTKTSVKTAPIRDPAYHVGPGDTITIDVPEAAPAEPGPEAIALDIAYEDDDIIVINKPAGLAEDAVIKLEGHKANRIAQTTSAGLGKTPKTRGKSDRKE